MNYYFCDKIMVYKLDGLILLEVMYREFGGIQIRFILK